MSKKRGNGEGSIKTQAQGRPLDGRFTAHTAKGSKHRHIFGRTRQEVAMELAKAMTDRDGGTELDPSSVTVNEYLQRWLKDSVKGSVRPITFESYERLVRVHVVRPRTVSSSRPSPCHLQALYRDRYADLAMHGQRVHAVIHRRSSRRYAGVWSRATSRRQRDPPKAQREEIDLHPRAGANAPQDGPGRPVGGFLRAGHHDRP